MDHYCFPIDLGLEFSVSYGHNLVHILTVGSLHLRHYVVHRLDLAACSKILKLLPGHLMFLKVL